MASSEKWLLGDNSMNVITHSNHANVQQELADAKQWMELIFFLSNSAGVCSVSFQSFQWLLGHDTLLRIDRCENAPCATVCKGYLCFPNPNTGPEVLHI